MLMVDVESALERRLTQFRRVPTIELPDRFDKKRSRQSTFDGKCDRKRRMEISAGNSPLRPVQENTLHRRRVAVDESSCSRLADVLNRNPLFSKLAAPNIKELIPNMCEVPCEVGQVVIHQGDFGEWFYVVESGRFAAHSRSSFSLDTLECCQSEFSAGDSFGEVCPLLPPSLNTLSTTFSQHEGLSCAWHV